MVFIRALYIGKFIRRWSMCTLPVFSQDCSGAWAVFFGPVSHNLCPPCLRAYGNGIATLEVLYVNITYLSKVL